MARKYCGIEHRLYYKIVLHDSNTNNRDAGNAKDGNTPQDVFFKNSSGRGGLLVKSKNILMT